MTDLPPARHLLAADPGGPHDHVVLDYDSRLIRRKRLVTSSGHGFLVDLPEVTNLDAFWGFELEDGTHVAIEAASEDVLDVTGPDLARYAWHIGNRHTPCRVEPDRLVIRADHVLAGMLAGLGATVTPRKGAFRPEQGAYGTGRPMGHASHDHGHDHDHGHHHPHVHHHGSHRHDDDDNGPGEPD
jgi:urease accessory protein